MPSTPSDNGNPVLGSTVGVIGLGAIGGNVAERLLELGVPLKVFDLNEDALTRLAGLGADPAGSASEAAASDFLITSLPGDKQLESVLLAEELLSALAGGTIVEISTVLPQTVMNIAEHAARHGVRTVDAPFSGGTSEARSGQLVFYAGADDESLAAAGPLLRALGTIEHIGPVGQGKALKLVNNVMSIGNMVIAAEAFEMGQRMGLSAGRMFETISRSGGRSAMFLKRMPRVLDGDFAPTFSLGLGAKDLRLARQLAERLRLEMPAANGVSAVLERALAEGLGDLDLAAVVRALEQSAD